MNLVGISGTIIGSKTRTAVEQVLKTISLKYPEVNTELLDMADYNSLFCDGRTYADYNGDTKILIEKILSSDSLIIGTPIFQASIPGLLKNLFDLLPVNSLSNKVVGILSVGGSSKHYLVADYQLKPILSYLKAIVIPKHVYIEGCYFSNKKIIDKDIILRLNRLAKETVEFSIALNTLNNNY